MRSNRPRTRMVLAALAMMALFATDAFAVVGRPLTPMSYAGVARRTTRRTVYAGAAVAGSHPVYVAPAPPPAVVGVPVLPAGCMVGAPCHGVVYRPVYQGATLVYVPQ